MGKESKLSANIQNMFSNIGKNVKEIGATFTEGDWKTKVSFLIMGFGQLMHKQLLRGIVFLAVEILFIYYMISFGAKYLAGIPTLGTTATYVDKSGVVSVTVYGDNSFLILLYGLLTIFVIFAFIFLWRVNIRQNRQIQTYLAQGRKLPTSKEDLYSLINENFDKTLLALPNLEVYRSSL